MPFSAGEWRQIAQVQQETRVARATAARERRRRGLAQERRVGQLALQGVEEDVLPPAAKPSPVARVGTCAHCSDQIYRAYTHTPPPDRSGRQRPRYVLYLCHRHYEQATGLAYTRAERVAEWRAQRELEERKAEEARIRDEPPK